MERKWKVRLIYEGIPTVVTASLFYGDVFPPILDSALVLTILAFVVWTELLLVLTGEYNWLPTLWELRIEKQVKTLNGIPRVGWFFKTISDQVEKNRTVKNRQEQHDTAERILGDYLDILTSTLDSEADLSPAEHTDLVERIVQETEQRKVAAYPILSDEILPEALDANRKAVEALIFAVEQDRLRESADDLAYTGEQLADFRRGVENAFEALDFSGNSQSKHDLVNLYAEQWDVSPRGENLVNMTDADVYETFVSRYYPHTKYPAFSSGGDKIDYRAEIVRLVQSELSVGNVQGELLEHLQTERERIKQQVKSHEAFFVCAKKIGKDTTFYDEFKEKFPRRIRIGKKYIKEPMRDEDGLAVWMRIVFPQETYGSAHNFREQSLSDIISDGVMVFVSEVDLPFDTHRSEDELATLADDPEKVRYVLSETDLLLTGHSEEEITQRALDNLAVVGKDVEDILTAIRLRSLVPDATSEEEAVFARNRDAIESDLGITRIFDWREQETDDVVNVIRKHDEATVSGRWDKIASELIRNVDAATPPEYKSGTEAELRTEVSE